MAVRTWLVVGAATLLVAACGGATGGAGAGAGAGDGGGGGDGDAGAADAGGDPDGPRVATVAVELAQPGRAVAPDLVGLSLELTSIGAYLGRRPDQLNPVFAQLLRNLGPGTLRLGGNSTDDGCWRTSPDAPLADGCTFEVSENALAVVAAGMHATGWRTLLGVDLGHYSPATALDYARDGVAVAFAGDLAGGLFGLEFGNEPDLYVRSHRRPAGYDEADHLREWNAYADALAGDAATAGFATAGPAYSGGSSWYGFLGTFAGGAHHLGLVTAHEYTLSRCGGKSPTIAQLLDPGVPDKLAARAASWVAAAGPAGQAVQMAEGNSVSCRGQDGTSNVFASALWGLDYIFTLAEAGVVRVNLHIARDGFYDAIVAEDSEPTPGQFTYATRVLPLYYAMLLAARAGGGAVLPSAVARASVALRVHAFARPDGSTLVYLVNADLAAGGTVVVAPSEPRGAATATTLRAPGLDAHAADVTLGGVQVDDSTGTLPVPATESIAPSAASGSYFVDVPFASAVLLEIPPP